MIGKGNCHKRSNLPFKILGDFVDGTETIV